MRGWLERNSDMLKRWLVYLGILFSSYMMFMHFYITSDYIPTASLGGVVPIPNFDMAISGGRFCAYAFLWFNYLLSKIHISYYENVYVIQIMGMMLYAWVGTRMYVLLSKNFADKRQRFVLNGAILLCFINPFMVETYVYGCFEWAVGIWLAVLAVDKLTHKKYVVGWFLALCATSVYQTNVFIVLILWLLLIFIENYEIDLKKTIKFFILAGLISASVAICSIALQKLVVLSGNTLSPGKEAVLSEGFIERVTSTLYAAIGVLWRMHGMLPRRLLFIFGIVLYGAAMYVLLAKKKKLCAAIVWTIMLVVVFFVPFSYGVVMTSRAFPARTILAIFFSISVLIISALHIVKDYLKPGKIISVASCCFAVVVIFYTETCILDCYIRQALDFNEAMCIQDEIREYEETTGIEIKTVSAGKSPNPIYYSQNLHLPYDTTYNYRIMHDFWAQTRFLNYVNHENYEVKWMDEEEYKKYFGTQSWTVFNPSEQLHFEGNTLYWAIY